MNKEQQFDFYWKEIFTGLAYNPIEFNTYRFDQSMSLPSKFNKLYEMFKQLALNNQEVMDYLKEFVETFDEKLYGTLEDVLNAWMEDGRLADVVRLSISDEVIEARTDYLDFTYSSLKNRLDLERKEVILAQEKIDEVSTQLSQTTEKITKRLNRFSDIDLKMVSITASPRPDAQVNGATEYNIRHLLNQGADATMVVLVNIASTTSSNLEPMDHTMFLEQIEACNKANLKIKMLKPHLVRGWSDAFDRGEYFPDDVDLFFNNWKTTMLDYAKVCHDYDIEWLCIGTEMGLLTVDKYAQRWIDITNRIKANYPNLKVTYACQGATEWKFRNSFKFVEGMDAIGLNTYLNYTTRRISSGKITQEDVNQRIYWQPYKQGRKEEFLNPYDRYTEIFEETRLPIIITEVGSMPIDEGLISSQPVNLTFNELTYKGQAMQMEAVFGELCRNPHVIGVSWWHVAYPFNYFSDDMLTEAEKTIRRYYKEVL